MRTKGVEIDAGARRSRIEVPEDACVAEFRSVPLPRDSETVVRQALAEPLGMPSLARLVEPGTKVTIAFDDPLRPPVTPRTVLPVLLEELARRGVGPDALRLISANGMHRRFTFEEFREYLGPAVAGAVGPSRILNHDCADESAVVPLGLSAFGGPVVHHRAVVESDLMIYVGNVAPNVWGGCGGMGAAVGLGSAESIAHHPARAVIGAPESCHGDQRQMLYQRYKEAVAWQLEKASGRPIFYVECVTGSARVLDAFAGHFSAIRDPGWEAADRAFDVEVPQADVLVVGLPPRILYGDTDNPLIALTGLGFAARMWKGAPVLREGGAVIGVTESRGVVDADRHPSYEEVIRLYAEAGSVRDLVAHEGRYMTHPEHLARFRGGRGFHPAHPFWLFYENEYEVIKYALGYYGKPLAPLDPDVLDRILATPAAQQYARREPLPPVVERVRARFGGNISDEEVLLRVMFPEEHVEAMRGAGPMKPEVTSVAVPLVNLIRALSARRDVSAVYLKKDGVTRAVGARAEPRSGAAQ